MRGEYRENLAFHGNIYAAATSSIPSSWD